MTRSVRIVSSNIKRLRTLKGLSQKEVSAISGIPQGAYSRAENGLVEPSITTLDRLAKVFEVSIIEFFRSGNPEADTSLPWLEKIRLVNSLEKHERKALETVIDIALSKKQLKEKLSMLLTS